LKINFRLAEIPDIDALIPLIRALYRHENLPFDDAAIRQALIPLIHNRELGEIWLIFQETSIIGYLVLTLGYSLEYRGRDAILDEVYIRDEFRGLGVGKRAIQFAEERCRSLGVQALHLEVERSNTRAQNFYRKTGFEDHDRYLMTRRITLPNNQK